LGFRFRVQCSRFKVQGSRFKVQGSRFRVQGRVHDSGVAVYSLGYMTDAATQSTSPPVKIYHGLEIISIGGRGQPLSFTLSFGEIP
jgi:hypothetical protein